MDKETLTRILNDVVEVRESLLRSTGQITDIGGHDLDEVADGLRRQLHKLDGALDAAFHLVAAS